MDTLRFPWDQEEHCHLENMVSSFHPTLSVLGKQGTQGSHPELVPDLDRGPGTEPETREEPGVEETEPQKSEERRALLVEGLLSSGEL